jgi:4-amino-4-deoxy-L-arabinose transferase-like glycosyltransferase
MRAIFKNFTNYVGNNWINLVVGFLIIAIAVLTLAIQPPVIRNHANIYESATIQKLEDPDNPWYRAVNTPYLIGASLAGIFTDSSLMAARLTSTIVTLASVVLFYIHIRIWFNSKMALVGSILFITNSLTLNTAHQATFVPMLMFSPLLIFATFTWFMRTKKNRYLSFLAFIFALAISAYTPYMLWFILIAVVATSVYARKKLKKLKIWQLLSGALLYVLILLPLFVSLLGAPGQLKELLGIPTVGLASVGEYFINLVQIISSTFIYASTMPITFLGNLPVLDVFSGACAILGIYFFIKRFRHRRSIIIFSGLTFSILLLALNNNFQIFFALLLPFLYIFVIAGIIEMLKQWFHFFPRNPLARNFGVTLIVIAIGLVSFYQLQRYYVAWANAPETKAVYVIKY